MIQKIKNSLNKRKVKVFLVFLLCSTSAWFISNLSESYVSNSTFKIDYANVREDLLLVNSSQDQIDVKLQAVGFQFLGFNFKKKDITIDLSDVSKEGRQYYLTHENYSTQIEKQLPSSMRLMDVAKDTLFFDFQEVISKEIPVQPQITIGLAKNYLLEGKLEIIPSAIVVKGPRNEVDTISNVKTSKIELSDLTSDFSRKATLLTSDDLRYTSFSETTAIIKGKVSKFSEKLIPVGVTAINIPSGTSIRMFPDEVNVLCKGTIDILKNLKSSDFEVVVDFTELKSNTTKTLPLKLSKRPGNLSSVNLEKIEVEYILKRE